MMKPSDEIDDLKRELLLYWRRTPPDQLQGMSSTDVDMFAWRTAVEKYLDDKHGG